MFAAAAPLIASGLGALTGMFGGGLSKEEKALLQQLSQMSSQNRAWATQLMGESAGDKAQFEGMARGVRSSPGFSQAGDYWSALLGGDRAKMQSAVAPSVARINETYRGGNQQLERSNLRGAAKGKAQAEMARQQTGQLAGLTQGVQGEAADRLSSLESQIQQLMSQFMGQGQQARAAGVNAATDLQRTAQYGMGQQLDVYGQQRQQKQNTARNIGSAMAPLIGYGPETLNTKGLGGFANQMPMGGAAPTPPGWTLPRASLVGGTGNNTMGGYSNLFGNQQTRRNNPFSGVRF